MSNIINTLEDGHLHDDHHEHASEVNVFGFWQYVLTDCILFATLFATFLVVSIGVTPYQFDLNSVFIETMVLLFSSFTFALVMFYAKYGNLSKVFFWLTVTFLLGATFMYLEISEFVHLYSEGNSWSASAYFSAFYTLVGTHGLHVLIGMFWMILIAIQLNMHGITPLMKSKLMLLSIFWHFLDIIWIFVFTVVYLKGAI